jgi:hypothetical protein
MAARLRKDHQEDVRTKIQVSNLITRLQKYANGELSDEDISPTRLNAIKLLLAKTLPDLSTVTVKNEEGEEFKTVTRIENVIIDGDTKG